jgi:dTDP-4-dehydrorhamnose 3,5-epimerase-like enzyme
MSKTSSVFDCSLITFDKNHQIKGNLTAVSNNKEVPFAIKRIYYLYDVPGGLSRGAHAHKELQQLVIALSGSFDITLDDGNAKRTFQLSKPNMGLLIPSGLWRELNNFSSGSICMVLASELYDEHDYIRDYDKFEVWKSLK